MANVRDAGRIAPGLPTVRHSALRWCRYGLALRPVMVSLRCGIAPFDVLQAGGKDSQEALVVNLSLSSPVDREHHVIDPALVELALLDGDGPCTDRPYLSGGIDNLAP